MGRAPCCDKTNVKRGPWSPEEDATLKAYIEKHGTGGNWIALPQKAGLRRCGKSCRLRWLNYLRPNIKHGEFSDDEDRIICTLFANIGSRWSIIAAQLPGRTDNDIKNYWNTKLKKKLLMGSLMINSSPYSSAHHKLKPISYQSSYPSSISFLQSSSSPSYSTLSPPFKYNNSSYNYSSTLATSTARTFSANNYENVSNVPISSLLNLQAQDHGFAGPMQNHHHQHHQAGKGSPLIMFGAAGVDQPAAATSCSSSDGSNYCNNNNSNNSNNSNKDVQGEYEQLLMFGGINNVDGNNYDNIIPDHKQIINNGLLFNIGDHDDQTPLEYYNSLEEIKHLISTNHVSCNSNFNFFVDDHENKTTSCTATTTTEVEEEKVLMYY